MGLSAEEVESLVSVPMEQALNGIDGLEIMRSRSIPDLSAIELLFKPGTDILRARQLAQERIATVLPTLPTWAERPVDDRLLDDQSASAARSRGSQRAHLGRTHQDASGAGGRPTHGGPQGVARAGYGCHLHRIGLRAAEVLDRLGHRHRRFF